MGKPVHEGPQVYEPDSVIVGFFLDKNVPHDESASKYSGGVIVEFF